MNHSFWLKSIALFGMGCALQAAKPMRLDVCQPGWMTAPRVSSHTCPHPTAKSTYSESLSLAEARIVGTVKDIHCGIGSQDFQQFLASIEVEKILHGGSVPARLLLSFTRFHQQPRGFNNTHVNFKPGEKVELVLRRQANSWLVQFPFHKRTLRPSSKSIPDCRTKRMGVR